MPNNDMAELLRTAAGSLTPEAIQLEGLKGIIAAVITMTRHEKNMSQAEFASLMNVSQGLVSRWENGETNFTLETLVRIASKLDIPMQCPYVTNAAPSYISVSSNLVYLSNFGSGSDWSTQDSNYVPESYLM